MDKRNTAAPKLTPEQRERLLSAAEQLLALDYDAVSFLEAMAAREEALRQRIPSPGAAPAADLAGAIRHIPGAWAAPAVLTRIAELRNEVGACTDYLRRPTPGGSVWKHYEPAMRQRLRRASADLALVSRALTSVPTDISAEEARRNRAIARVLEQMLEEADLRENAGTSAKVARRAIALRGGISVRTAPEDRWTEIDDSISRKFRRHKEARALFHRIRNYERSRT